MNGVRLGPKDDYPLPTNYSEWQFSITFMYVEDDTGNPPRHEHANLIGETIHLTCESNETLQIIRLSGKASPYKHDKYRCDLVNHEYGVEFDLHCTNLSERVIRVNFWRCSLTHRQFRKQMSLTHKTHVLQIDGDCRSMPVSDVNQAIAHIILTQDGKHADSFEITVSKAYFDTWVKRRIL